jgi:hypothetical protein
MAEQPPNPNTKLLDDPNDPGRQGIIRKEIVIAAGLHDGSPSGGTLWDTKKAKDLIRADLMALAGFGATDKFDSWNQNDLKKLSNAVALHCDKTYTGMPKYLCCTCG